MRGKPVDYLWSFLIGGALCVAAQLVFELLLSAGVEFGLSITLMLAIWLHSAGRPPFWGSIKSWKASAALGQCCLLPAFPPLSLSLPLPH